MVQLRVDWGKGKLVRIKGVHRGVSEVGWCPGHRSAFCMSRGRDALRAQLISMDILSIHHGNYPGHLPRLLPVAEVIVDSK